MKIKKTIADLTGVAGFAAISDVFQPIEAMPLVFLGVSVLLLLTSFYIENVFEWQLKEKRGLFISFIFISGFYFFYNAKEDVEPRPLITFIDESAVEINNRIAEMSGAIDEVGQNIDKVTQDLKQVGQDVNEVALGVEKASLGIEEVSTKSDQLLLGQTEISSKIGAARVDQAYGTNKMPIMQSVSYRLSGNELEKRLVANFDGNEVVVSPPEFFEIDFTGDIDNNGYRDIGLTGWAGGNCCDPWFSALYMNYGDGVFQEVDVEGVAGQQVELVPIGTGYALEYHDRKKGKYKYIVAKGKLELISGGVKSPDFIDFDEFYKGLHVKAAQGDMEEEEYGGDVEKIFIGKLNNNETEDEIHCYRSAASVHRNAFLANCRVILDGHAQNISMFHAEGHRQGYRVVFNTLGIDRREDGFAEVYVGVSGKPKSTYIKMPLSY